MKVKDIALKIKGLNKVEFEQLQKELEGSYSITNGDTTTDGDGSTTPNPGTGTGDNGNDTHPKPPVP